MGNETGNSKENVLFPPEWLEKYDDTVLERLAIMTIDGGLSDDEALRILGLKGGGGE